jgi:hypothetical protein
MAPPLLFRKSDIYHKKLMRLGAAMRRYSNDFDASHHSFNSLSQEVDALEELSLSAFSLMKAIKTALVASAETEAKSLIIRPFSVAFNDGGDDE